MVDVVLLLIAFLSSGPYNCVVIRDFGGLFGSLCAFMPRVPICSPTMNRPVYTVHGHHVSNSMLND